MAIPRRLLADFPDLSKLDRLTTEELLDLLRRFGVTIDVPGIEDNARAAFARAKGAMRDAAGALDPAATAALDTTIRRAFDGSLRAQIKGVMGDWRNAVLAGTTPPAKLRDLWVAVMDTSTCASCEARHGEERTFAEWALRGLPRSAALICRDQCRCELFPVKGEAPRIYVEVATL